MAVLQLENVRYSYVNAYVTVDAVRGVSYAFEEGKFYALRGASGCGKTTLLSLMAGLDLPTDGCILYKGKATSELDLDRYRRDSVAVIYQAFNLLPQLTVAENIMYPMELNGMKAATARKKSRELVGLVGLTEEECGRFPSMLSGGQQQRVAVARALGTPARVILADEPTGNLDTENTEIVIQLLAKLAHESGYCVIVVTHDDIVCERADVVIAMADGRFQ